ncbi:uncharacterized protein LOC141626767 isoform X1 [Silene latifolia]|uniref:uncharacterized protein LOC141626767 isoform X1 n=1 Tax=Silene latifolia TaxID=37657 RepID=UPI003D7859E6
MLDTYHEIAVYIHRFHNLDLFQQGWYQIKITMNWEDGDDLIVGIPSKVVQYEAPNSGSSDGYGFWRINDVDNSFATQPFKIRYARQDVPLSVMIAFNVSLSNHEVPSTSGVIIKFELLYASLSEQGPGLQAFLSTSPAAAIHEFRVPPKALLGIHSYCPILFDAFHSVLVDASIHISILKSVAQNISKKVPSISCRGEDVDGRFVGKSNKGSDKVEKEVLLVKALLAARDILLEEAQKLSRAIDQSIDLTDFISQLDDSKLFGSLFPANVSSTTSKGQRPKLTEFHNSNEKAKIFLDFRSNGVLMSLSKDNLLWSAHIIGDQIHFLWTVFLKFHRANKTKITEYLRESWAKDRKTEWSIWMVHSKVDMPHHYISRKGDDILHHGGLRGKVSVLRKIIDDPPQAAAARAEQHRRSIAQMMINSRSIEDLQMFGDPLHVPVLIVERVINAPKRSYSGNSYFCHADQKASSKVITDFKTTSKMSGTDQQSRVLKIVVFVHGFQGHHLDLRLVRNQWLLIDPKVEFLMSEANEDKTFGDFREMGHRLAKEVVSFVKKKMEKFLRSGGLRTIKLSFVGHSIGNVIIRTSLADSIMEPYLRFLHTYVSVSGPHLGYLYSSNPLFNSGLWLLRKLKNTQCINQLTLTDESELRNTFIFKLCQQKTLESFRNIILLSSPQDGYVPYHSARIELCPGSSTDFSKKGEIFVEMLNNCLDQIRSPSIDHRVFMRCDVNFNMSSHGKNLDTFIGRAAHIEFLETDIFAKLIMWSFPEFFQ